MNAFDSVSNYDGLMVRYTLDKTDVFYSLSTGVCVGVKKDNDLLIPAYAEPDLKKYLVESLKKSNVNVVEEDIYHLLVDLKMNITVPYWI